MDEVKNESSNPKVVSKKKLSEKLKLKKLKIKKPNREFLKGFAVGGASGLMGGILVEGKLGLTNRFGNDYDYDHEIDDPDDFPELEDPTEEE